MGASKIVKNREESMIVQEITHAQLYDLLSEGCCPSGDNMISVCPKMYADGEYKCIVHESGNVQLTPEAVVKLFKADVYYCDDVKLILVDDGE